MTRKRRFEMPENAVDRQIREAQERGEFDDLPGKGKPIPDIDTPYDDLWWVKKLMAREELSVLPESLEVRRDLEKTLAAVLRRGEEADVRRDVEALNRRIRALNSRATSGPPSTVMPLDVEVVVERWRARSPGKGRRA